MKNKELIVNLAKPPSQRWHQLNKHKKGSNALIQYFSGEILDLVPKKYLSLLSVYLKQQMLPEYLQELNAIASILNIPLKKVAIGNLYYDVLKLAIGCSAFSANAVNGPIHARNLDWFSNQKELNKHSLITRFINGKNEYVTIGWPGFTGCLSGMAIGKFSITLNAVSSADPYLLAPPVVYLIRQVLETANCFDEAIALLANTQIASDCLLMVCGTKSSEMAVVERTPTRGNVRFTKNGRIMATNNYKQLTVHEKPTNTELHVTSCGRYNRMDTLLQQNKIITKKKAKKILSDNWVKMDITMQQMYFNPKKGIYKLY